MIGCGTSNSLISDTSRRLPRVKGHDVPGRVVAHQGFPENQEVVLRFFEPLRHPPESTGRRRAASAFPGVNATTSSR